MMGVQSSFLKLAQVNFLFAFLMLFAFGIQGQDLIKYAQRGLENQYKSSGENSIDLFKIGQEKNKGKYEGFLSHQVLLEISFDAFKKFRNVSKKSVKLRIPVSHENSFDLELEEKTIHSKKYLFNHLQGVNKSSSDLIGKFYQGKVVGDPNSKVAVSVFRDYIRMLIFDKNGNYVLAKLNDSEEYILYNDRDIMVENRFKCGVDGMDTPFVGNKIFDRFKDIPTRYKSAVGDCIDIYVEADHQTYLSHGSSITSVNNYISALINEVGMLYEFGGESIPLHLDSIHVHTSPDPYAGITDAFQILLEFGEQVLDSHNASLAHLISTRNITTSIAWVDVLCDAAAEMCEYQCQGGNSVTWPCMFTPPNNVCQNAVNMGSVGYSGPFAVSLDMNTTVVNFPTYSWDVNVFAHEMGHNFGSQHTHACVWGPNNNEALDDCFSTEGPCAPGPTPPNGGTIMSYCHLTSTGINFNNSFGQEPWDLIYNNYVIASCSNACACEISNLSITNGPTCNGNQIEISLQFDVSNGSGTYKAQLFNDVVTLNSTITDGTINETILLATSVGTTTLKVYDNTDNTCFDEVMNVNIPDCTCSISGLSVTSGPTCVGPDVNFGISFNPVNSNGPYAINLDGSNIGQLNATSGSFTVTDNQGSVNLMVTDINATGCSANTSITIQECGTCSDGIKNQGESGVDCGGPCSTNCPCTDPDDKTYTNQTIPNGTDDFVNDWILTTGTVDINNGSTVNLRAGNYIELMPGFEIKVTTSGSVLIDTEPCDP